MRQGAEINEIQANIMRRLFLHDSLRFAELNADDVPSDQFSYHLRQLLKYGLLEKMDDGQYTLSVMGRSRANMLAIDESNFIEQGFLAVRVHLTKYENGQKYYLMQERLRVPYRGTYGSPGDKVMFGEDVGEAAKRAMRNETGLECTVKLRGLTHYKDNYQGEIVQDKYFLVFSAQYVSGKMREVGLKGNRNVWLTLDELKRSPKTFYGVLDMIEVAESGQMDIDERTFEMESY